MYNMQELHLFSLLSSIFTSSSIFSSHSSIHHSSHSIYLPTFFYIYNFHNLNTHQYNITYRIHIRSYQDSKHILYQSLLYIHIDIYHYSNVVYYDNNTLTFKSFTTSATYFCVWIINIITIATSFTYFNTKMIKYRIITVNINNFRPCFTCLFIH